MIKPGKKILIVEDEPLISSLYQEFLNDYGFDSTVCEDGLVALETFEQANRSFDLVITDQTMPNMTGTELSTALLDRVPTLPIILLTGSNEMQLTEVTKDIAIQYLLQKPISLVTLKEIINSCLS